MSFLSRTPSPAVFDSLDLLSDLSAEELDALSALPDKGAVKGALEALLEASWTALTGGGIPCTLAIQRHGSAYPFVLRQFDVRVHSPGVRPSCTLKGVALKDNGAPGDCEVSHPLEGFSLSVAIRDLTGQWRVPSAYTPTQPDWLRLKSARTALSKLLAPTLTVDGEPVSVAVPSAIRPGMVLFGVNAWLLQQAACELQDHITLDGLADALGCSTQAASSVLEALESAGWVEAFRDAYYVGTLAWYEFIATPVLANVERQNAGSLG